MFFNCTKIGFFENAFDNIGLAFTFNNEKKIQKALELAEKRLAEAEILSEDELQRFTELEKLIHSKEGENFEDIVPILLWSAKEAAFKGSRLISSISPSL